MSKMVATIVPEMADNVDDFWEFNGPLEGNVPGLYCDILGLITCSVGNLVDPINLALDIPWQLSTGLNPAAENAPEATREQVIAAWRDIKANKETLKKLHWKYALQRNNLRLSSASMHDLLRKKLFEFESYMEDHFCPGWRDFPADAQLGMCSIAWACGPAFLRKFVNFRKWANANDWANALLCATIREAGNPGVVPRNVQNRICFSNAALVVANGLDRDVLFWPKQLRAEDLQRPALPATEDEEQPELEPIHVPWLVGLDQETYDRMQADKRVNYDKLNDYWS